MTAMAVHILAWTCIAEVPLILWFCLQNSDDRVIVDEAGDIRKEPETSHSYFNHAAHRFGYRWESPAGTTPAVLISVGKDSCVIARWSSEHSNSVRTWTGQGHMHEIVNSMKDHSIGMNIKVRVLEKIALYDDSDLLSVIWKLESIV